MSCNCNEPKKHDHFPHQQVGHSQHLHHGHQQQHHHQHQMQAAHQGYMHDPYYQFQQGGYPMPVHGGMGMPMQPQMIGNPPNAPISQYHETGFYGHMPLMNGFGTHPAGHFGPMPMNQQGGMGPGMQWHHAPAMQGQGWQEPQGHLPELTHPQLGARGAIHPNSYMPVDDEDY